MAAGEVSWDYRNSIPPLVTEYHGTPDGRLVQSERSNAAKLVEEIIDPHVHCHIGRERIGQAGMDHRISRDPESIAVSE